MDSSELDKQLNKYLTVGFPKTFIQECSTRLNTLAFTSDKKEEARDLFLHLSSVISLLATGGECMEKKDKVQFSTHNIDFTAEAIISEAESILESSLLEKTTKNRSIAIGYCCYNAALQNKKSGDDFLTLFADCWFSAI